MVISIEKLSSLLNQSIVTSSMKCQIVLLYWIVPNKNVQLCDINFLDYTCCHNLSTKLMNLETGAAGGSGILSFNFTIIAQFSLVVTKRVLVSLLLCALTDVQWQTHIIAYRRMQVNNCKSIVTIKKIPLTNVITIHLLFFFKCSF